MAIDRFEMSALKSQSNSWPQLVSNGNAVWQNPYVDYLQALYSNIVIYTEYAKVFL